MREMDKTEDQLDTKFKLYIDKSPDGVFIANSSGRYTYVNPTGCAMLGYSLDELLQFSISDIDITEEETPHFELLSQTGEMITCERTLVKRDGTTITVELKAVALGDNSFMGYVRDISESKLTEKVLAETERRFKLYIEKSPDAILIVDGSGHYVDANPAACAMLGYTKEELLQMNICEISLPTDQLNHFEQLKHTGEVSLEKTFVKKDGTVIPVEMKAVALGDDLFISYSRDISRRKQAERTLMENNHYQDLILNSVTDHIVLYEVTEDLNFKVLKGNQNFYNSLHREEEEVVGRFIQELVDAKSARKLINYCKDAAAEGEATKLKDYRYGNSIFDINLVPIKNASGQCTQLLVISKEITERRMAEKTIQVMETKIHEIINSINDGFYTLDKGFKFTFANEIATKTFGKTRSEIIGKKLTDIIPKEFAKEVRGHYTKALQSNEPVKFEIQSGDSWFQTNIYPVKDGLSVFFQNVTEKKRLQHEFLRLDRLHLIGQMSAGIGHEIRNPMTTVRGFLQMLGVSENDPKKREYFDLMIEELDRANSIITEFLSLAKDKVVNKKPASLNVILNTLFPLLNADAIRQDKRIILNKGDIANLLLNEKEIRQLVFNLVRNGLESMPSAGVLELGTYTDKDEIILYVKDQGAGIQPEILEKLGSPFVTTKDTGTGLGLAMCYSIAHRHNAKIDVKTAPSGTTFLVRFNSHKSRLSEEHVS